MTEATTIPPELAKHLQDQQNAAMRISCLLDCIIPTIEGIMGEGAQAADSAGVSLRHVNDLVSTLCNELDTVSLRAVVGDES